MDHGDPLSRLPPAGTDAQGGSPKDTSGWIGGETGTSAMRSAFSPEFCSGHWAEPAIPASFPAIRPKPVYLDLKD